MKCIPDANAPAYACDREAVTECFICATPLCGRHRGQKPRARSSCANMAHRRKAIFERDILKCRDCQAAPPYIERIGGTIAVYSRCGDCLDTYRAKRDANRIAKLKRFAQAMRDAGARP